MIDFIQIFPENIIFGLIKILSIVIIGLYLIFSLILLNKTKSLGKIVFIQTTYITPLINFIVLAHFIASIMLFIISIVIL